MNSNIFAIIVLVLLGIALAWLLLGNPVELYLSTSLGLPVKAR